MRTTMDIDANITGMNFEKGEIMKDSLIKKENGFINRIKKWVKEKWKKTFNYNNDFKSLVSINLGGHGRMFETEDKFGKKYLFKTAESKDGLSEPFRADIQEAIYKLQQEINPQGAISCFTTTIEGLYGAVQERVETSDIFNILNWQLYGGEIPQNILDGILQEYVVDWVSGNFDSHGSHFLVDTNGNVKCCDKEQAFRYVFDENSLKPDLNYNPNTYSIEKLVKLNGKMNDANQVEKGIFPTFSIYLKKHQNEIKEYNKEQVKKKRFIKKMIKRRSKIK